MARKKLNKKVAIIGSLIFALFLVGVVVVILRLTQDPAQFIKEGDVAREAKDYETAERSYAKAFGLARKTPLKIEIAFKLADLHVEKGDWMKAAGTWNSIVTMDPKNIKARQKLLEYMYEVADNGHWTQWRTVETNCSDLIDIQPSAQLYFQRGRARYEMALRGQTTDREKAVDEALEDLEKARQQEPNHGDTYRYLAKSILIKGQILASKGLFDEERRSSEDAQQILQEGIKVLPQEPELYIDLLSLKVMAIEEPEKQAALESEFLALADKFHTSPEVFVSLSEFYTNNRKDIDKAIQAIEKAMALDPESAEDVVLAAQMYYRRGLLQGRQSDIQKAMEIAQKGLDLPGVQDVPGPRKIKNRTNRLKLCLFLGNCLIEEALSANEQSRKEDLLARATKMVHEIQQIYGTRDNPQALMWEGRLALAEGEATEAIKKMYASYEQLKTQLSGTGRNIYFAYLCYTLAKVFNTSTESGACGDFLRTSIEQGLTQNKPAVLLDYATVLLNMGFERQAMDVVELYEDNFTSDERSKLLYARACIRAGLFEKAEEILAQVDPENPDTIALKLSMVRSKLSRHAAAVKSSEVEESSLLPEAQAEIESAAAFQLSGAQVEKLAAEGVELIEKLLQKDPNYVAVPMLTAVCNYYLSKDEIEHSKKLVDMYLKHFPESTSVLIYKKQLYEPKPTDISSERRNEIIREVLSTTGDELKRCLNLGSYYKDINEPNNAMVQYTKALEIDPCNSTAIVGLFDMTMSRKDYDRAEQLVEAARRANLDGCHGQYFAGRLALAREQFKEAVAKFNIALKERPVFSQGYLYRSVAYSSLGNSQEAVSDARRAVALNPVDGKVARRFAGVLYRRNLTFGADVTPEQYEETRDALLRAAALNPGDSRLVGLYASYISEKEPREALAYRQRLQAIDPSVQNAIRLANVATDIAMEEKDSRQKQALLDIASSSFDQALEMSPGNKTVLSNYARYYRRIGEPEKAEQLLAKVQDKELMWKNYMSTGRPEKAKEILDELYKAEPNNLDTVRGLFALAERTRDKEGVIRYSNELLRLDPTSENHLLQIQAMLQLGILKEAQMKLERFNEKFESNELSLQLQALLSLKMGQYEKALKLVNQALEISPNNEKAWYLRGRLYHLTGNYVQAVRDLQKSKSLQESADVRIQLAKSYLRVGRVDDAITELNTALNDEDAPFETREILEGVYRGLGRKQDLIKLYTDAIEKYPDGVTWYNKAAAFLTSLRNYQQAAQFYLQAWNNSQKLPGGGNLMSFDGYLVALKAGKQYDRLFRYARRYIDDPAAASVAFGRMAEAKAEMGDTDTAAQYYYQGLEKAGDNAALIMALLKSMYSTIGRRQTEAWCQQRLSKDPYDFVPNFVMYNIASMVGEYNRAIQHIDKCIQTIKDDDPKKATFVTYRVNSLQSAYARTSDNQYFTTAVEEYKKLLEKTPNNISVLNNIAYMLADNDKDLDKAMEYAGRAYDFAPDSPDIMDTYAFVLYKSGKYRQAAEIQRSAVQLFEQSRGAVSAEVYRNLGMIVEKLGEHSEALSAYKQAKELGEGKLSPKDMQYVNEAIERLSEYDKNDNTNTD